MSINYITLLYTYNVIIIIIIVLSIKHVQGGEVVTLKWKKVEGYISVSSSLTNQALPEQLKTIAKGKLAKNYY